MGSVTIHGATGRDIFTLIILDPDMPSASHPTLRSVAASGHATVAGTFVKPGAAVAAAVAIQVAAAVVAIKVAVSSATEARMCVRIACGSATEARMCACIACLRECY